MMLRNRDLNIKQQEQAGQVGKNNSKAAIDEPAPKKRAASVVPGSRNTSSNLLPTLSNVFIDSAKKAAANGVPPKQRSAAIAVKAPDLQLSTIDENCPPAMKRPYRVSKTVAATSAAAEVQQLDYDFDRENAGDLPAVSEYAQEIFIYYKAREPLFKVHDYMPRQRFINTEVRAQLANWMVEVQETFELNHETLYLAVKLLDLYLDRIVDVKRESLQLIASSAFFIASKFDERQPPLIDDFVYLSEDSFDRDQLLAMERQMLETVGFDLGAPLSYRFLRRYARVSKSDMETLTLARYVLETSLMFFDLCRTSESQIATACLLLALRMKRVGNWSAILEKYTGYTLDQIEPLMWALNHMILQRKAKYARLDSVYKKYSHKVFHQVALINSLEDQPPPASASAVESVFKRFSS